MAVPWAPGGRLNPETPEAPGPYSSQDPYNPYPAGRDPNRNKDTGLAYGLPYQLRSTFGPYAGVSTLLDILRNPGQTDMRMFNQSLAANARDTQGAQDSALAGLSRSGFGGSGLGAALQAAIGRAGTNQRGNLFAEEARRREDLKRSDLDFLERFFVQPKLGMYAANKNYQMQQQQASAQKKAATMAAVASLVGSIAGKCHTADELYGVGSEEAKAARVYMAMLAEPETSRMYGTEGGSRRLALQVRDDPALRAEVREIFDVFVERGKALMAA